MKGNKISLTILLVILIQILLNLVIPIKSLAEDMVTIQCADEVFYSKLVDVLGDKVSSKNEAAMTITMTKANVNSVTALNLTNSGTIHMDRSITNLSGIENFKQLTKLNLNYNHIEDITPLAELTNLKDLHLYINDISNVFPLSTLSDLQSLDLENNNISDISPLQKLENLKSLKLGSNNMTDDDIKNIKDLKKLETLYVDDIGITNKGLEIIADNLENLKTLYLSQNNIDDISSLKKLTKITELSIANNNISDIKVLGELKNLSGLFIHGNDIEDISILSELKETLKTLSISAVHHSGLNTGFGTININENELNVLSDLKELNQLWMNGLGIKRIDMLKGLTKLNTVDLGYNSIEDISDLEGLTNLHFNSDYNLKCNQISMVISNTTKEVPLPQIIKAAKDSSSKIYTEQDYTLTNCTLSSDGTKIIVTDTSKEASIKINGGNANGTVFRCVKSNPVEVKARNVTYNGQAQALVTTTNAVGNVYYNAREELTEENYKTKGNTEIPKEYSAGTYTVYYYAEGGEGLEPKTGHVDVTIRKATNPTIVKGNELTFTGKMQNLVTVEKAEGTVYYSTKMLTDQNYDTLGSTTIPTAKDAGIYGIYYYVKGNTNYEDTKGNVTAKIVKIENPIEIVGNQLTYTGEAQELVTTRKAEGTVYYSARKEVTASNYNTGDPDIKTEIPKGTGTYTWTVYYYGEGNKNYNAKAGSVQATIGKADNPIKIEGKKNLGYTGNEQELVTVENSAGDKYTGKIYYSLTEELGPQNKIEKGSINIPKGKEMKTYTVYYWAESDTNYNGKAGKVEVTIGKGDNPIVVVGNQLTYTGEAQELVTTRKAEGTVYYSARKEVTASNYNTGDPDIKTEIPKGTGTYTWTVYYYVEGNKNYNAKAGSVQATIAPVERKLKVEIAEYGTKEEDNTKYITKVKPGTTLETLENKITTNGNIEVYDQGQKITNKKMNLKTGMKIVAKLGEEQEEYTIVVIGDVTGNGKIGLGDISKIQRYILEIDKNLTGAYLEAADVNMDGKYGGQGDLVKMMRVLIELDRL